MLLVARTLRHRPDLVAAIVKPPLLSSGSVGAEVLALELLVHEKIIVAAECHLHQAASKLRDDDELQPLVRHCDCFPSAVVRVLDTAGALSHKRHDCVYEYKTGAD